MTETHESMVMIPNTFYEKLNAIRILMQEDNDPLSIQDMVAYAIMNYIEDNEKHIRREDLHGVCCRCEKK